MKIAQHIVRQAQAVPTQYSVLLTYDERFLRRKKLVTVCGIDVSVQFDQTTSLDHGDHLECTDGTRIAVIAKAEALAKITGPHLAQLAWHIGNRHTPCHVADTYLLIQQDRVIEHMIEHLGGQVTHIEAPFTPLGGAYGHGRTHSHEHGATTHVHAH